MTSPRRLWHPLLYAAYPVLFLYAHNTDNFSPGVLILPLLVNFVLAGVVWGICRLVLRASGKASLLASLLLTLFFAFGHVTAELEGTFLRLGSLLLGQNRLTALGMALLLVPCLAALVRTRSSLRTLNGLATFVGLILVGASLIRIAMPVVSPRGVPDAGEQIKISLAPPPDAEQPRPHVVNLILDGYARGDVLAELYGFDNRPLLEGLEARGFYVADLARANYCQTTLSLASSLNLDYLDLLVARVGKESIDREPLRRRIKHSLVARLLQDLGYVYVAFATGYYSTEARNADVFFSPGISLDEFQNTLLSTTPVPLLLEALGSGYQEKMHRRRIRYTLENLGRALERDAPAFVLAHIVAPHPPFVFNAQGGPAAGARVFTLADGSDLVGDEGISSAEYRRFYTDQLRAINAELLPAIDRLIAASQRPVIIFLQADHGPGSELDWEEMDRTDVRERMAILTAYRLPGARYHNLHEGITPVNAFRIIFDQYFGTDLGTLPERCFFSTESRPYTFHDVTRRVAGGN